MRSTNSSCSLKLNVMIKSSIALSNENPTRVEKALVGLKAPWSQALRAVDRRHVN